MTAYSYTNMSSRASLLNVGWLDSKTPFPIGEVPPEFIERVETVTLTTYNAMRGIQGCFMCEGEHIHEIIRGERVLLGMSEVWFPSPGDEFIYIAPSLFLHYIISHNYLPPRGMVRDVVALPGEIGRWDTPCGSYRKLIKRHG
ncbi:MAG: hypothetical protein KC431_01550 [Myxococcales bacterium]|nr:hypothetical protein [Myxococcales bacterium]